MLAEKTGWSERFILWELPLHRFRQYLHAGIRAQNEWTIIPMPSASDNETAAACRAAAAADKADNDEED